MTISRCRRGSKRSAATPLAAAALLCVLGPSGCALIGPPDPDDFTFSSVAVVYSNDRTDDTWPKYDPNPNRKLLKIAFTTKFDLLGAAFEKGYNVWNRIDFCHTDTDIYSLGVNPKSAVFWNGIDMQRSDLNKDQRDSIKKTYDSTHPRTFYVYLNVVVDFPQDYGVIHGEPPPLLYSLDEKPEDVCLTIHGGALIRRFFTSNTVFIPRQVIANALGAPADGRTPEQVLLGQ
jgi:hypothetical protein